jgi:hypothetical protein
MWRGGGYAAAGSRWAAAVTHVAVVPELDVKVLAETRRVVVADGLGVAHPLHHRVRHHEARRNLVGDALAPGHGHLPPRRHDARSAGGEDEHRLWPSRAARL